MSSETDTPSEMDCGNGSDSITPPQSNKGVHSSSNVTNAESTEDNSMESGVSSTMEFKEPDKCDSKSIGMLSIGGGAKTVQRDVGKTLDSNIVPCDSTSGSNNNSSSKDQINDRKEAEKMTVDEGSCG